MALFPANSRPVATSCTETKFVLVSVLGHSFSSKEDASVTSYSNQTAKTSSCNKSRLEAVYGPSFAQAPAPANFLPDLAESPKSESMANDILDGGSLSCNQDEVSGHAISINGCRRICGCETCRHLKSTSSGASTSGVKFLSAETSSDAVNAKCAPSDDCSSSVEINMDQTPVSFYRKSKLSSAGRLNIRAPSEPSPHAASSSGADILGDRITDEMEVEDILSSLEMQCKEALDIEGLITVTQRLGNLQQGMRMLSMRLDVTRPVDLELPATEHMTPGQDLSQIDQKLQDLTERIGPNDNVVAKEEVRKIVEEAFQSIHKFQKQVHQRIVPRIALCTSKGKGSGKKLIHKLTPGVKSVRLHMLCEQEGEEHKVEGALGCALHLKTGESWDAIYPFLNKGLMVFEAVSNIAGRVLGVGDNLVPSPYSWLQEFNSKVVEDDAKFHTTKTPQAAAEAASPGAEQWLVNHLTGRDIMQDFGLQRMLFEKPGSQPESNIVWLCKQHAESGKDSEFLTHLPQRPIG